jgi:hypothetical protein
MWRPRASPAAAQLNGALAFSGQTGAQIATLDVVEIGLGGQQCRLAGLVSVARSIRRRSISTCCSAGARRRGPRRGDSLTGTWVEAPLDGGLPSASGTFRASRLR